MRKAGMMLPPVMRLPTADRRRTAIPSSSGSVRDPEEKRGLSRSGTKEDNEPGGEYPAPEIDGQMIVPKKEEDD